MSQPREQTRHAARTRSVSWADPAIVAREFGVSSGAEFLGRIVTGDLPPPPIAEVLGFRLVRAESGSAVFEFEPAEYHYNPIGVVHGGMAGILLDSAMGCAVHTTLPAGVGYTTLEFKVNLVRSITAQTGLMRAEGRAVHVGSKTATADGRLVDAAGKLYAHATTTCLIMARAGDR